MKRTVVVFASFLFMCQVLWAGGKQRVAIVRTGDLRVYEDVVTGFTQEKRRDVELVFIEEDDPHLVRKRIRDKNADLILAIGGEALDIVLDIDEIAILYASPMVPRDIPLNRKNIAGVSMNASPEKQMALIREAYPNMTYLGVVYSAKWTKDLVEQLKIAGIKYGLHVIAKQVRSEKGYARALYDLLENTDGHLMLPDDTDVLTPNVVEVIFEMSDKYRFPVITFSEKYLREGAVLSIGVAFTEVGRQTWEIADKMLRGNHDGFRQNVFADLAFVMVNCKAAEKFRTRWTRIKTSAIHVDRFFAPPCPEYLLKEGLPDDLKPEGIVLNGIPPVEPTPEVTPALPTPGAHNNR